MKIQFCSAGVASATESSEKKIGQHRLVVFIQAVQSADIPIMAAYLCLIALVFVVINLVVDLLYFAVDPRLRIERAGAA